MADAVVVMPDSPAMPVMAVPRRAVPPAAMLAMPVAIGALVVPIAVPVSIMVPVTVPHIHAVMVSMHSLMVHRWAALGRRRARQRPEACGEQRRGHD